MGSEQFAWKLWPEAPHVCAICDRELRVKDVRRHETRIVRGKTQPVRFFCAEHVRAA